MSVEWRGETITQVHITQDNTGLGNIWSMSAKPVWDVGKKMWVMSELTRTPPCGGCFTEIEMQILFPFIKEGSVWIADLTSEGLRNFKRVCRQAVDEFDAQRREDANA